MAPSQETTTSPPPSSLPKRSKGKLFQCTGYPGCSMVFTRSEHLARHIRKHTGERPFQCNFCMKKFSRLDNLRQHKQTVHQFENSLTHGNDPDNDASSACTELPKTKPGASFLPQNADGAITYKNQHKVGMHYGINKHQHAYIHPHNYSHYQNLTHNQFLQREIGNMEHLQQNMVGHELKDESFSLTPSSEINPQTPSFNNRLPGMISPPNSVSRHVHVNIQKSMLPPPRQNILLHKPGNGFSDVRPALANKPVPIIIDNSNNELHSTNNNQLAINKLMTPTTANGTSMDISPVPIHLNQFKQQQNSPGIPVFQNTPNSTFSSPLVSPSMSSFGESAPSPHNLAFVLQQQQQQQMYSNSLTPTNSNFEYRNGPYLSPLYYQRTPLHPQYHLPPIPQQMHCVPSYNASMRQKENTPYGINDMHAIAPRNGMKGMAVVNGMNSDKNMNGLQVNQTNYYSYYNYGGFNNELNHSNQITSIRHVAPKQQKKSPLINSSILISPSAESVDGHKGEEPEDGDNEKENEKKIPQTTSDEDECKVNGKDSRHNPKNVRNDTNESCTDKNACKITTEMANQIGTDDKETLSNEKGLSPKPTKHISPIIEIVDTDAGMVKSTPNSLALDPHSAVDKRPVLANLLNG